MKLFPELIDSNKNILTKQGIVNYYGKVLNHKEASAYYHQLLDSIDWQNDVANIFGKQIITKRKVAWYGEKPFEYTYSNNTRSALLFTPELQKLKTLVEQKTGETYNSCLLNLYHNGSEGMAWHSDGERDLKEFGAIASLSFGAERKFGFKHKETKETVYIQLEHGSTT